MIIFYCISWFIRVKINTINFNFIKIYFNQWDLMSKQIIINLPVKNLKSSVRFFTNPGFSFNSKFTDESATCMVVSDSIL